MNAPDPPRWALNSCFGASRSVWMHFGLFCYCTMLDTKRAELVQLMQKFVPQSRIGFFRNERNQPTPLDPKLMFLCVSLCLGAFGNVSLLHETWCKMGWTDAINAQVCAMKSHQNFGLLRYCMKLGAKWAELVQLMQKFLPRSPIGIFRNECTRSTP